MRQPLFIAALAASLSTGVGCRREEKIKLEPTDESNPTLVSTVRASDPQAAVQLIRGFHGLEQNTWRWTMGKFVVTLKPPAGSADKGAKLTLKFSLPEAVLDKVKSTTLTATMQSTALGSQTFSKPGEHVFTVEVPSTLLKAEAATVEFAMDHFLPAGSVDGRELGLVFVSVGMETR